MLKFVFKFDGLLRQRRHVEKQKQRALAEAQQRLAQLQSQKVAVELSVRKAREEIRENSFGKINASLLAAQGRALTALQRLTDSLGARTAAAANELANAQREYSEAAKRRKVLENLREQQQIVWQAETARKESIAMDEAAARIAQRRAIDARAANFPRQSPC